MVDATVIVNSGATVWLSGTVHLSALDIAAGVTVRVLEASNHVLVTNGLSIAGPDSNDNPGGLLGLGDSLLLSLILIHKMSDIFVAINIELR